MNQNTFHLSIDLEDSASNMYSAAIDQETFSLKSPDMLYQGIQQELFSPESPGMDQDIKQEAIDQENFATESPDMVHDIKQEAFFVNNMFRKIFQEALSPISSDMYQDIKQELLARNIDIETDHDIFSPLYTFQGTKQEAFSPSN